MIEAKMIDYFIFKKNMPDKIHFYNYVRVLIIFAYHLRPFKILENISKKLLKITLI